MLAETKKFIEWCRPQVTPEVIERAKAARRFVHTQTCPDAHLSESCLACPTVSGVAMALFWLEDRPRDAQGARVLLHDVVCVTGCSSGDHARRTQSKPVAAIRKFRVSEQLVLDEGAASP